MSEQGTSRAPVRMDRGRVRRVCTGAFLLFAWGAVSTGCLWFKSPSAKSAAISVEPLAPSPRLRLGHVVAVDTDRSFAFVELASDAPVAALAEDSELIVRSEDLRETARLRVSRHVRGRTLGTTIVRGLPLSGQEVVWLAP